MSLRSVDALFDRLARRGQGAYGLSQITQLAHGLQSAALAQDRKLGDAMTIAALFHDVGHLGSARDVDLAKRGIDDRHEIASARILERLFGPEVSEPVRLHVLAKRYLCSVDPAYRARLAPDSRRSLELQGGGLAPEAVAAFEAEKVSRDAVALRRIDDDAKMPGLEVPPLERYRDIALARARAA